MLIGKRIRELREEKKLSQGEIAQRTGLLRHYISRVENGHTVPSLETLERLAAALDLPLYQLFHEGDDVRSVREFEVRGGAEKLASDEKSERERRSFKRIRRLLEKESRASDDADLAFGTLAKLFSKL